MSRPPYRGLSIGLRVVSVLIGVGGLIMVFSSQSVILWVFMHPPESEVSTLLLALLKEMGGLMLMLSVMLFLASRDPARHVAILSKCSIAAHRRYWARPSTSIRSVSSLM